MLSTLLSVKKTVPEKKKKLEQEYHLSMTKEMESEVAQMCNLSLAINEEGERKIQEMSRIIAEKDVSLAEKNVSLAEKDAELLAE